MPKPRVLIVDDHADLRRLIALTLGSTDYELVEAVDGPTALDEIRRRPPHLILLDLMLPGGIDGIEICRRVRDDPRCSHTRVVLLTAADQAPQRERAKEVGVDSYLPKPFSPLELRQLVVTVLGDTTAE